MNAKTKTRKKAAEKPPTEAIKSVDLGKVDGDTTKITPAPYRDEEISDRDLPWWQK